MISLCCCTIVVVYISLCYSKLLSLYVLGLSVDALVLGYGRHGFMVSYGSSIGIMVVARFPLARRTVLVV